MGSGPEPTTVLTVPICVVDGQAPTAALAVSHIGTEVILPSRPLGRATSSLPGRREAASRWTSTSSAGLSSALCVETSPAIVGVSFGVQPPSPSSEIWKLVVGVCAAAPLHGVAVIEPV